MVTRNEPYFEGHFPGHPVMPGVLIIEALAQAGALYAAQLVNFDPDEAGHLLDGHRQGEVPQAGGAGRPAGLEVIPLRKGGAIWKMRGEAKVDGVVVAEAELMASIQPRAKAKE